MATIIASIIIFGIYGGMFACLMVIANNLIDIKSEIKRMRDKL